MNINVRKFVNPHRLSNTYLLSHGKVAVIIDVGNLDVQLLVNEIRKEDIQLKAVLLTHEHADHCYGVDNLRQYLDFKLYASQQSAIGIQNSRLNFSRYLDEIPEFVVRTHCNILSSDALELFSFPQIHHIETPGHSPGSSCYLIEDMLFTGDTWMTTKTPLSFPNSDKKMYAASRKKIISLMPSVETIFPGHGEKINL